MPGLVTSLGCWPMSFRVLRIGSGGRCLISKSHRRLFIHIPETGGWATSPLIGGTETHVGKTTQVECRDIQARGVSPTEAHQDDVSGR